MFRMYKIPSNMKQLHAVQVPPPIDGVLPWETVQEDGTIVSNVSDDGSGDGIMSAVVGSVGHLVRKGASAVGRKLHIIS